VVQQVGSGLVRLGLALVGENGRYALGIATDGPGYHRIRCARDRDRIQAEVLARLGWPIHRVWSQCWWLDPEGERRRLLAAAANPPSPSIPIQPPPYERYDPPEAWPFSAPSPLTSPPPSPFS
jgi:hypothetical protein